MYSGGSDGRVNLELGVRKERSAKGVYMNNTKENKIEVSLLQELQPIYWGALGVGGLLMLIGFKNSNYVYLIVACFLGIFARIIQAECHVRIASNRESVTMTPNPGHQADG
jgi:hypothetical protein